MLPVSSNQSIYANDPNSQAGSVGGFFRLPASAGIYGITNFHVVEKGGMATLDAPIFRNGGQTQIGKLKYWYELENDRVNFFDMALFEIDQTVVSPSWIIPVGGWADANAVDEVQLHKGNGTQTFGDRVFPSLFET